MMLQTQHLFTALLIIYGAAASASLAVDSIDKSKAYHTAEGDVDEFSKTLSHHIENDDPEKGGKLWVVLAAGSWGWENYRHQADVCHAYHILAANGVPEENIVVMLYDDVANDQRKVIYAQRNELMEAEQITDIISAFRNDVVASVVTQYIPEQTMEDQWDVEGLEGHLQQEFELTIPWREMLEQDHSLQREDITRITQEKLADNCTKREADISEDVMRNFEKSVVLQVLDNTWKEHLAAMDHLRAGIHLRGYAQRDPKQEYKRESFEMFVSMLDFVKYEVVGLLSKVQVNIEEDLQEFDEQRQEPQEMNFEHAEANAPLTDGVEEQEGGSDIAEVSFPPEEGGVAEKPFIRDGKKVGRNDPCPCESGKKYKQCHGKLS